MKNNSEIIEIKENSSDVLQVCFTPFLNLTVLNFLQMFPLLDVDPKPISYTVYMMLTIATPVHVCVDFPFGQFPMCTVYLFRLWSISSAVIWNNIFNKSQISRFVCYGSKLLWGHWFDYHQTFNFKNYNNVAQLA